MSDTGYVDVMYADEYVSQNFLSTDPLRNNWEKLFESDKKVFLRRAFKAIESLTYTGRKTYPSQPNAFPRWPSEEVPEVIKEAQVENALSMSDSSTAEDSAFYNRLWQFGVESYSIGNLSEHISSGGATRNTGATSGIVSTKASKLLQPYISGGYRIVGGPK